LAYLFGIGGHLFGRQAGCKVVLRIIGKPVIGIFKKFLVNFCVMATRVVVVEIQIREYIVVCGVSMTVRGRYCGGVI